MDRRPLTSTPLMRLPTTSLSRSRRMVSTSGSSGMTGGLHFVGDGECRLQLLPRNTRGRLFRLLLRTALARTLALPRHQHAGVEALGVVGPVVDHLVAGQLVEPAGRQLLQPRLVVLPAGAGRRLLDALSDQRPSR